MIKLTAHNIEMRFGDRQLFSTHELEFAQGQTIHLQGDNGSGKTTLMKLLAGLIRPTRGKIRAEGFSLNPWWRSESIVGKAIYLHQHPYLFEGSVGYNLAYPHAFCDMSRKELTERTRVAAELAQLERLLQQPASSLSGGEKQRLAIARAWIMQPRLLMLDEPTSNMDKHSQQLVLSMISELKRQGTGLLISSHQACTLTSLCEQNWKIEHQDITTSDSHGLVRSHQEYLYAISN